MSFMSKHFPSKFLKASDIVKPLNLTIETVVEETLRDGGSKPVTFFVGEHRGLILNKTNGAALCDAFGSDETGWAGKQIRLVSEKVDFGGKRVDAIRIQIPALDTEVVF